MKSSAKNDERKSDAHMVAIPASFYELFYGGKEVIDEHSDDLVRCVDIDSRDYGKFLNLAQAYGVVYQEVIDGSTHDFSKIRNQEEIAYTASHLLKNSEQIRTLLH